MKSDTTKAIHYALGCWDALMRFCDDLAVRRRVEWRLPVFLGYYYSALLPT